mgnify:CR=1 FL=1
MRLEQLTFLRFVAAFALVIYHYGTKVFPFNTEFLNLIFRNSNLGVSFFFVLSGYVLMLAYGNKKLVSKTAFFKKRFARIYPVYIVGISLMVFYYIAYGYFGNGGTISLVEVISNVFLLQAWIPQHALTINYVGWSLSVEVLFYLLFPIVLSSFNRFSLKRVASVVFLIWIVSQVVFWGLKTSDFYDGFPSSSHNFLFYFPLFHLNQFLVGALGGWLFVNHRQDLRKYILWFVPFVIVSLVVSIVEVDGCNGLLSIVFVCLLMSFSVSKGSLVSTLVKPVFVFLGGISYSVYILQVPVFEWLSVVKTKFSIDVRAETFFFVGCLVLIFVSSLSFRFVEKPIRNWILLKN